MFCLVMEKLGSDPLPKLTLCRVTFGRSFFWEQVGIWPEEVPLAFPVKVVKKMMPTFSLDLEDFLLLFPRKTEEEIKRYLLCGAWS